MLASVNSKRLLYPLLYPYCAFQPGLVVEEIDTAVEYERTGGHNACRRFNDRVQRLCRSARDDPSDDHLRYLCGDCRKEALRLQGEATPAGATSAVQTIRDRP